MCMLNLLSDWQTLPLISQSRRMIREGPVIELMDFSLKDTERSVYLHLFNDYLLLSLQKEWADVHSFTLLSLPTSCFLSSLLSFPWTHPSLLCSFFVCILLLSEEEDSPWSITRLFQSCVWRTVRLNSSPCRRICSGYTCQTKPFCFEPTCCKNLGTCVCRLSYKNVVFLLELWLFFLSGVINYDGYPPSPGHIPK